MSHHCHLLFPAHAGDTFRDQNRDSTQLTDAKPSQTQGDRSAPIMLHHKSLASLRRRPLCAATQPPLHLNVWQCWLCHPVWDLRCLLAGSAVFLSRADCSLADHRRRVREEVHSDPRGESTRQRQELWSHFHVEPCRALWFCCCCCWAAWVSSTLSLTEGQK